MDLSSIEAYAEQMKKAMSEEHKVFGASIRPGDILVQTDTATKERFEEVVLDVVEGDSGIALLVEDESALGHRIVTTGTHVVWRVRRWK